MQTIPTVRSYIDSIIMAILLIGFFQVLGLTAAGYLADYRGEGDTSTVLLKLIFIQYLFCVKLLAVTLKMAGNVTVGGQFCPGSTAAFECQTTEGSLLWETSSTAFNHAFNDPTQPPTRKLGIFLLRLDGIISQTNGMVSAVNSTAVVDNVKLSDSGTTLKCSENVNLSMFSETVLRVAGECNYVRMMHAGIAMYIYTTRTASAHFRS